VDPREAESTVSVNAWGEVAAAYREYWGPRFKPFVDEALEAFEPADGTIAVPGCGPGDEALALAARFADRSVAASDPAPPMVALLSARLEAGDAPNLTATIAGAAAVSGTTASAGGIFCSFMFQLLPDKEAALRDWASCLAPGGRAAVLFWPPQPEGTAWRKLGEAIEQVTGTPREDWRPALRAALPGLGLRIATEGRISHAISYASPEEAWERLVTAGSLQSLLQRVGAETTSACAKAWLDDHGLLEEDGAWVHRPEATLWILERTVTHAEFLELETLNALRTLYRERGVDVANEDKWLEGVQQDWRRAAMSRSRLVTEPPDELPPVRCERDGVNYAIYGVIHGLIGGSDKVYKAFVDAKVGSLEHVLFENGLQLFYPKRAYAVIPDYEVLGVLGSMRIGLEVARLFPLLLWEGLGELFKRGSGRAADVYDYSPVFHAVDPETRRGLDEWPPLPSRLQIDYEMSEWKRRGFFATLLSPYAIAPRSLFMAGYAEGYASSRKREQVSLVVGDLHAAEIQRFLEGDAFHDHALFKAGQASGRRSDGIARVWFWATKIAHLLLAGMSAVSLFAVVLAVAYLAVG
jgi:ubiquinone/menaquinone biosynthesis C-methylase UbiE